MQVVPKLHQKKGVNVWHVGHKRRFLPPNFDFARPPNYWREVGVAPIGVVCKNRRRCIDYDSEPKVPVSVQGHWQDFGWSPEADKALSVPVSSKADET